ncbi:hypothetical protein HAX54_013630 [Datura stramonium]|uniref:Uncharacterized protein n=1 Tax=Datura stramonium TaxID=4076 RepID=A0ABS8TNH6_DATST|nr:hypothetical protein [Datura stramonium]
MFTLSTLEECECVQRRGGMGSQSIISDLIVSQENSTREVERLTGLLAQRDAEIANLKAAQMRNQGEEYGDVLYGNGREYGVRGNCERGNMESGGIMLRKSDHICGVVPNFGFAAIFVEGSVFGIASYI